MLDLIGPPFVELEEYKITYLKPDDSSRHLQREAFRGYGDLEYLSESVILDESWEDWLRFQRSAQAVIPIQALKRLMVGAGRYSSPGTVDRIAIQTIRIVERDPLDLGFLLKDANPMSRRVDNIKTKREAFDYESSYSPFAWVLEGQGLLSGVPWSWENFIPRLLTIAGIIVFGFLLTEFLHLIYRIGVKMMGRNQLRRR